jgi:hypothetical protein
MDNRSDNGMALQQSEHHSESNTARRHPVPSSNGGLPPKFKKMRLGRSKPKITANQWNDRVVTGIPEYRAYNDQYA